VTNASYSIERSFDGNTFETIANIKGRGNSQSSEIYGLLDSKPMHGPNYYRLLQRDETGTSIVEKFIMVYVSLHDGKTPVALHESGKLRLFNIFPESAQVFHCTVYDSQGRNLFSEKIQQGTSGHVDFSLPNLASGIYHSLVQTKENNYILKFFVR
jgi:hypothetical protein